ncbi:adenylate kinase [Pyrenophora tritici-repentis]|nr:adenylate kinase [Pyrenophora tritici-repentis]
MAPMADSSVDDLKNDVKRLEQRIAELESRLAGHGGVAAATESVRMILMGPPGAGELVCAERGWHWWHSFC